MIEIFITLRYRLMQDLYWYLAFITATFLAAWTIAAFIELWRDRPW